MSRVRKGFKNMMALSSKLDFRNPKAGPFNEPAWIKSERRDLNSRPSRWQRDALPLRHFRTIFYITQMSH